LNLELAHVQRVVMRDTPLEDQRLDGGGVRLGLSGRDEPRKPPARPPGV